MKKLLKIKPTTYAGFIKPEIGMLVQIENKDIIQHGWYGFITDIDMSLSFPYGIQNIPFENRHFQASELKPIQLVVITEDERPKENTMAYEDGFNGDWFWCSKYNSISECGDITPFDFKIIASYPNLDRTHKLSKEFVEQWCYNPYPTDIIEVDYVPIHAVDCDGFKIPYAFESTDKLVYDVKINEFNEISCSFIMENIPGIPKGFFTMGLDLSKLEEKLDDALESETKESLSDWLLKERIKQSAENYYIEECIGEPLDQDTPINAYIAGAKSEASKIYWFNKFKLETNAK